MLYILTYVRCKFHLQNWTGQYQSQTLVMTKMMHHCYGEKFREHGEIHKTFAHGGVIHSLISVTDVAYNSDKFYVRSCGWINN